jgi:hypothetical protein
MMQTHRTLYHYTAEEYLPHIRATDVLTGAESNPSRRISHAGPHAVLLTTDKRPKPDWPKGSVLTPEIIFAATGTYNMWHILPNGESRIVDTRTLDVFPLPWIDKSAIRFTVSVPAYAVHHWPAWSRQHGIDPTWSAALGKGNNPNDWYVVLREIPRAEWVRIERTATGEVLWEAETHSMARQTGRHAAAKQGAR